MSLNIVFSAVIASFSQQDISGMLASVPVKLLNVSDYFRIFSCHSSWAIRIFLHHT